ncbi:MAG: hypothetical protein D6730_00435 [Bacteroidetes bacterium]|nr:MAG: hypothetical protein D6730_00435 [Bacteroidota bacterium]
MKDKEKQAILYQLNDAQIQQHFQAYQINKYIGLGIMAVGVGVEAAGLITQVRDYNSGELSSNGSSMVVGGALIVLAGAIFNGPLANGQLRKSAERYQQLSLKPHAGLIHTPFPSKPVGLGLSLSF